jgi:hypothetical protein
VRSPTGASTSVAWLAMPRQGEVPIRLTSRLARVAVKLLTEIKPAQLPPLWDNDGLR